MKKHLHPDWDHLIQFSGLFRGGGTHTKKLVGNMFLVGVKVCSACLCCEILEGLLCEVFSQTL